MMTKNDFGTLSQTVEALKEQGYDLNFNIKQECLICHQNNTVLSPDEFETDAVYRKANRILMTKR